MRIIRDTLLRGLTENEKNLAIERVYGTSEQLMKPTQDRADVFVAGAKSEINDINTAIARQKQLIKDASTEPTTAEMYSDSDKDIKFDRGMDTFFGEGKKVLSLGKGQMFDFIEDDQ
jgi:hypothetical protein